MVYNVNGKVQSANDEYFSCLKQSNYKVKVYKALLDSQVELSTLQLNDKGEFSGTIESDAAAITLRLIYMKDGREVVAAKSDGFCHHDAIEVPFSVDESKLTDPVFNETVTRLQEFMNVSPETIGSLTDEKIEKLSCLSCVSGKTIQRVKAAYKGYNDFLDQVSAQYPEMESDMQRFHNLPEDTLRLLFALFGKNPNASVQEVLGYSNAGFTELLNTAVANNEIPAELNTPENLNALATWRNAALMSTGSEGFYDAHIVNAMNAPYSAKAGLLDKALDAGSLMQVAGDDPAYLKNILDLFTLDAHLQQYPPLLQSIAAEFGSSSPDYFSLTLAGPSYWSTRMVSIPPQYVTKNEYAQAIFDSIATTQPSARVAYLLPESGVREQALLQDILTAYRQFNIEENSAVSYFSPDATSETYLEPENIQKMQRLQRAVKLSDEKNSLAATKALIDLGLDSSYALTRQSKVEFTETMVARAIPAETAAAIYTRAQAINSTVSMLMTQYLRYDSKEAVLPWAVRIPEPSVPPLPNLPDLESLFGNLDTCTCSECQSVYSPVAYLTDLLHWLGTSVVCSPSSSGRTGFKALMESQVASGFVDRRKDIRYLKLNCKNTNTLIPYIDLVNEILSVNLLKSTPGYPPANVIDDYKTLQTTKTEEELLQQPEHRFPAAEALLKTNFYQWALPYDANFDAATQYLSALNKPYAALINDFSKDTDKNNNVEWARAYLNFSVSEGQFMSTNHAADANFWKVYWGFESADLSDNAVSPATPNVGAVLRSAGLTLDQLNEILGANHINGETKIAVVPYTADACDIDKYKFSPKFSIAVADRFMRFVRYMRKTGLSVTELDVAIANLSSGGAGMDAAFMQRLARCLAFAREFSIPFNDVMTIYGKRAYAGTYLLEAPTVYYKDKFMNPLLPADVIEFFDPAAVAHIFGMHVNDLSTAQKQMLARALKTSLETVQSVLTVLMTTNPLITYTELSQIDRYCTFVKLLNVEPDQLANMNSMFGITAIAADVLSFWQFIRQFSDLMRVGVSFAELHDLHFNTGNYSATNADLLARAEALWNQVEAAYKLARLAHPEKGFNPVAPHLPLLPADQAYFADIILDAFRLPFDMNLTDARDYMSFAANSWVNDVMADPEGLLAPRTWANRKATFMAGFMPFNRVQAAYNTYGFDASGITASIDIMVRWTEQIADDYLYWMNSFIAGFAFDYNLWCVHMPKAAKTLDMDQRALISANTDFLSNYNTTYTASNTTGIVALYNQLGDDSIYKDLSVFEFTQTFLRAKQIAYAPIDLVEVMTTFEQIYNTVKLLGYNVTDGWSWVWNSAGTARVDIAPLHEDIRRVLQNKSTPETWSDVIVPIQNGLRERLRNAFVALYIGTRGYKNENALYAYFLLDTQMAPCNQTSRIVAAISSAQLLVHRALLGIEANVCMDDDDRNEWEWRKNYRVWEANRKVFLYPENWIDPTLRGNKTEFFEAAETLLQQDEINHENSEEAFAGYLTGLNDVAHLDIRATYYETPDVPQLQKAGSLPAGILHVFGRTWNAPYIYYYRNRDNSTGVWTAWEKMDLETDSEHLIPVIFNRKLYVFFPLFIERQHKRIKKVVNGESESATYYDIKMCYTKRDFGKWSNKKVLDGTLQVGTVSSIYFPNTETGLLNKLGKKLADKTNLNSSLVNFSQEVYLNSLLWKEVDFPSYAYTSLQKTGFYFWPDVDLATGDLTINCRRGYAEEYATWHDGYAEMANEWGFRIGACDEKVELVPPLASSNQVLSRPHLTVPYYQQMKKGKDNPLNAGPNTGLWTKSVITHAWQPSQNLFKNTNGDYVLTYPSQFKNNITGQPFFFADKRHNLFIDFNGQVHMNEHPYTCKMLEALNRFGIEGLLNSTQNDLKRQAGLAPFFAAQYQPNTSIIKQPYPTQEFDFSGTGTYSIYNWEVFFHTVSLIARQLRQNNQFEDAVKWINFVFDPSNRDTALLDKRYWKVKPFLIDATKGVSYYMRLLSASGLTAAELAEKQQWEAQINAWRDDPFDPHLIASMRPRAYMLWTVMELIETLTDWADYLFRQDTTESINEAINLYVLASELLGQRPKKVSRPAPPDYTYDDIMNGLNAFSNASVNFENYLVALNVNSSITSSVMGVTQQIKPTPAATTLPELIFCIPDNPQLTAMWDRVEDRLFKIRNCMNIDGRKRQLALFSPPIDPALLVRAAASGLDLSDVLADLATAPPHYRFSYLLQRANDFCGEVKSLGAQLLSALEKKDGEELALIRQVQEQNILKASRTLKELQLEESKQSLTTLEHSKTLIQIRLDDYSNRQYINSRESAAQQQTALAEGFMYGGQGLRLVSGLLGLIPDAHVGMMTFAKLPGGDKIAHVLSQGASALEIVSSVFRNKAAMSQTYAGYDRRQEEWNLQIKSATEELLQIDRQLLSAEIRVAMAEKELENHDLQAENSAEVYDYLRSKYTNQQLYSWMAGQLKALHRSAYELAYNIAKMAQQAFFKELGDGADTAKVVFGNWDSGRAGLLAGERLSVQLRELETSYIQNNTRDYELNKNISLAMLDPIALERLRGTGTCDIVLPEVLFDLDHPGHYNRKIRSVSISIPGIAGPYTNVNATLTLLAHNTRSTAAYSTAIQPVASFAESIATSSAQNDGGVFELSFRDERYMPFENKGVVSRWRLELDSPVAQFDLNSLSDVIMHLQYTAKEGGTVLATAVKAALKTNLNGMIMPYKNGFYYALNLRHDMPNEWHLLKQNGSVNITIPKNRLPYFAQLMNPVIDNGANSALVIAENATAAALTFKLGGTSPTSFPVMGSGADYYTATFSGPSPTLNLGTSFPIVQGAGNNFTELVLIVKIKVS